MLLTVSAPLAIAQTGIRREPNTERSAWTRPPTQEVLANPTTPQTLAATESPHEPAGSTALDPDSRTRTPIDRHDAGAPDATDAGSSVQNPLWTTLGILCLLLVGVYAFLQLLRRFGGPRFAVTDSSLIHVLDQKRLDSQSTVYLLRIGRRIVVTGSAPTGLHHLTDITDPEEVAALCGRESAGDEIQGSLPTLFAGIRPFRRERTISDPVGDAGTSPERESRPEPTAVSNREAWHA